MSNDTILARIGGTPLVRLNQLSRGLPVDVYEKCEFLNPGGSVKDRIALAIIDDAEQRGLLQPGDTLVEATAGNTGVGTGGTTTGVGRYLKRHRPGAKTILADPVGSRGGVEGGLPHGNGVGDAPHGARIAPEELDPRGWPAWNELPGSADARSDPAPSNCSKNQTNAGKNP
jgi:cysteine synthase